MMNWLIGIFSFQNKAVKKITQYQKQESMPERESPKNTDRPPEPDFLNTNTRLQLLSQRKKKHTKCYQVLSVLLSEVDFHLERLVDG